MEEMKEMKEVKEMDKITAKELMNLLPIENRKKVLEMVNDAYQDICVCNGAICEIEAQYRVGIQAVESCINGN